MTTLSCHIRSQVSLSLMADFVCSRVAWYSSALRHSAAQHVCISKIRLSMSRRISVISSLVGLAMHLFISSTARWRKRRANASSAFGSSGSCLAIRSQASLISVYFSLSENFCLGGKFFG